MSAFPIDQNKTDTLSEQKMLLQFINRNKQNKSMIKAIEEQQTKTCANSNADFITKAAEIISNCESLHYVPQAKGLKYIINSKKISRLPKKIMSPSHSLTKEQIQAEKCIKKILSKYSNYQKKLSIRKSDLGEVNKVFTEAELSKLELIDEMLQKGWNLPNDLFCIDISDRTEPVIIIPKSGCNEQGKASSIHESSRKQAKRFNRWSTEGNKENIAQAQKQLCQLYLDNTNFSSSQVKRKQKKELKALHFQKVSKQKKVLNTSFKCKQRSSQANQLLPSKAQRQQNKFRTIDVKILNQFSIQKYTHQIAQKKFGLPCSFKENLTREVFKQMNKQEKINQMSLYFQQKYEKVAKNTYMTTGRIQALYQCDMIRGAREIMNKKDYANLKLVPTVSNTLNESSQKNLCIPEEPSPLKKASKQDSKKPSSSHIEEIVEVLEENKKRLKLEKLRVIQKLKF